MSKSPEARWPFPKDSSVVFKSIDQGTDEVTEHDETVVFTDGWREGNVAAVLRGGINATAALELLAKSGLKHIRIIHVEERIPQLEEIFLSTVVMPANALFESVTVIWRREASVFDLIKKIGAEFSMLVFGAPLAPSELVQFYEALKLNYAGSVTIVRGAIADLEVNESDPIARWSRERTFEADDFSLAAVLRNGKRKLGKTVSVLLPSLNEERTVGLVIKAALEVKQAGIIDEVILIDSDSTDRTVEIARSYGIKVYSHSAIEPQLGSFTGKGEAMFKSGFVTDADILAWVDTDIENITPRFFYGLLGPLLTNPALKFSKGYFTRPVRVEASGLELGGGRVTEILARPWINAFMPELSGYIQPLAGTVAIYRETFLKMRIPINYGVEMAMLMQVVAQEGLWSTCQVNLGDVIHKSKDVSGLSEMAFQILLVLADMGSFVRDNAKINDVLRRTYSSGGHFEMGLKRFRTVWRQYGQQL